MSKYYTTAPAIGKKILVEGAKGKFKDAVLCEVLSEPKQEIRNPELCYWVEVEIVLGPFKGHRAQITLKSDTVTWID